MTCTRLGQTQSDPHLPELSELDISFATRGARPQFETRSNRSPVSNAAIPYRPKYTYSVSHERSTRVRSHILAPIFSMQDPPAKVAIIGAGCVMALDFAQVRASL
jgi:hypothetical protein